MSLTSRVANLFSSGSTTSSREDRNELADNGLSGGKEAFTSVGMGTSIVGSETMAPKALEEEGRPPYLHVGRVRYQTGRQMLNTCSQ